MKIEVSKKMGNATFKFEFEGSTLPDALYKASFLMDNDNVWGAGLESFKDKPVWFSVRKTKEGDFIYVERKSRDADGRIASSTLGTYKDGGHFWKSWEVYDPNNQTPKKAESDDLEF